MLKQQVTETTKTTYGFWKTVIIVVSGHLGVRRSAQRKQDFEKANGLHVFAVAVLYFVLINVALIVLVNYVGD